MESNISGMFVGVNCTQLRGASEAHQTSDPAALWGSLQVLEVDCASCKLGVIRAVVVLSHH